MTRKIKTPLSPEEAGELRAGETVYLTGTIFTARDRVYARIVSKGMNGLPGEIIGGTIYHCGPIIRKRGREWQVVAAGPTTSNRMSDLMPAFMRKVKPLAIIGKGGFDSRAIKSMTARGCVYLAMTGGTAALAADMVKSVSGCYWGDMGMAEAVWGLEVESFGPLVVAIDSKGNNLYMEVDAATRLKMRKALKPK